MKILFVSFSYNKGLIGNTTLIWDFKVDGIDELNKIENHLKIPGNFHPYGVTDLKIINFRRME